MSFERVETEVFELWFCIFRLILTGEAGHDSSRETSPSYEGEPMHEHVFIYEGHKVGMQAHLIFSPFCQSVFTHTLYIHFKVLR